MQTDMTPVMSKALSKYRTIANFAIAIGWTRNKASRVLNGVQKPDVDEVAAMSEALGIDTQEEFMRIFFAPIVHKVYNENEQEEAK